MKKELFSIDIEDYHVESISVDAIERKSIQARIYGKGKNIVILHPGLGRNGWHYHNLAKSLAKNTGYSIVTFDPRGHYIDSITGEPENVYSFEGMKEDLNSLVSYFKNSDNLVKIIGFSNGALVTAHISNNPHIAGLCMVSCPISLSSGLAYGKMCNRYKHLSHEKMKERHDRFFSRFCRKDSYIQEHRNDKSASFKIGKLYVKNFPQHVRNIISASTLHDLPENINTPATFIFAKYDFILKSLFSKMPAVYKQIFKKFKNLNISVISRATHGFGISKKEEFSKQTNALIFQLSTFIKTTP